MSDKDSNCNEMQEIRKKKIGVEIGRLVSKVVICVAICITIGIVSCHDNSFINRKIENQQSVAPSVHIVFYGGVYG